MNKRFLVIALLVIGFILSACTPQYNFNKGWNEWVCTESQPVEKFAKANFEIMYWHDGAKWVQITAGQYLIKGNKYMIKVGD